jgi:hypothetical protein
LHLRGSATRRDTSSSTCIDAALHFTQFVSGGDIMRAILAAVILATSVAACGGRTVEVKSSPSPVADAAVNVTNNLTEPVNVYVNTGGEDIFLGQVGGGSAMSLPVKGVTAGSSVTLKATRMSDKYSYSKSGVVLSGTYLWQVP